MTDIINKVFLEYDFIELAFLVDKKTARRLQVIQDILNDINDNN